MDWLEVGIECVLCVLTLKWCWSTGGRAYRRSRREEREVERQVDDVFGDDEDQPRGLA